MSTLRLMGASGGELARTLRERRRALGLTRARLAALTEIDVVDLAAWEHGDTRPDPGQVVVLAEAIGLGTREVQAWLDAVTVDLTGPDVAVELVASSEPPGDPFRGPTPVTSAGPLLARLSGRVVRGTRPASTIRRPAPATSTGLVQRPRPAHLPAVFPEPAPTPNDPETRVYSTAPVHHPVEADRELYLLRTVRTGIGLIALGLGLWWAAGSLWEVLGVAFDSLLGTPAP